MDILHHYIGMLTEKKEDLETLNRELIGPPQVDRPTVVDERTGIVPPAWWKGDDFASKSSMAAAMTLKRNW